MHAWSQACAPRECRDCRRATAPGCGSLKGAVGRGRGSDICGRVNPLPALRGQPASRAASSALRTPRSAPAVTGTMHSVHRGTSATSCGSGVPAAIRTLHCGTLHCDHRSTDRGGDAAPTKTSPLPKWITTPRRHRYLRQAGRRAMMRPPRRRLPGPASAPMPRAACAWQMAQASASAASVPGVAASASRRVTMNCTCSLFALP